MRALLSVALLLCAVAGFGRAQAADLRAGGAAVYGAAPIRAGQYYVYDVEPGVYVRAYWAAPWQNRHYFPFTGKKPKVGRHERLSAKRSAPKPAESYYRAWSTVSLYPPQVVMPSPDNNQPLILNETTQYYSAPPK